MVDLTRCMDRLGYRFHNVGLLRRALTHSSLAAEQHRLGEDNERLEYLGDAVLEHLVSRYIYDAHPEMREGGRDKDSILSDAFEAVLAAVYLDGGLDEARVLAEKYVFCAENGGNKTSSKDSKTAFQEMVHADHKGRSIRYELVNESGPDHKKAFTMRVLVDDVEWGVGQGPSKQAAGQAAAQMAMERYTQTCD